MAKLLINSSGKSEIGLNGFDPVSFHSDLKGLNGDPGIQATVNGTTYLFATEESKATFLSAPDKYLPRYGGYCAFGVSAGALFPIDVTTATIRDGDLFFCVNPTLLKMYLDNYADRLGMSEANWPKLVEEHGE